jgi:hypothetical protein
MGYQIEVVVVPDGDEKGVYVSPDAYGVNRDAFASERAFQEGLAGRIAVIRLALDHRHAVPVCWGPTQEQWERLIGLVVCGLAERKFL